MIKKRENVVTNCQNVVTNGPCIVTDPQQNVVSLQIEKILAA